MKGFGSGAEKGGKAVARCYCFLYGVEFGLYFCQSTGILKVLQYLPTFVNPLFRPYIVFSAFGSENERAFGPNRTISPCFSCSLMCSTSGLRL
jgi:hypothetical protein